MEKISTFFWWKGISHSVTFVLSRSFWWFICIYLFHLPDMYLLFIVAASPSTSTVSGEMTARKLLLDLAFYNFVLCACMTNLFYLFIYDVIIFIIRRICSTQCCKIYKYKILCQVKSAVLLLISIIDLWPVDFASSAENCRHTLKNHMCSIILTTL